MSVVLAVKNLSVTFFSRGNAMQAVKNVSFDLLAGEILAIVGESGSGKSVTSQALTALLPESNCKIEGSARLRERELIGLRERDLRAVRGKEIAYIFQNPQSSLNPVYTIGWQLEETLKTHLLEKFPTKKSRRERVAELLLAVGLKPEHANAFPFELSGGMQQRVMIAMAIAGEPRILIADEPTTALDVTVQAQIMDLLLDLRKKLGMSILLITHNFGLVAKVADRVCVMFRGDLVETGTAKDVIAFPQHNYTRSLLAAVSRL